ncbi:1,4-dihydroxy-2-naphthoate octaprenyltransferase [Chitinivibrio alkaliphilus ACht1]|uniref:1,4-dihydroxy-2-naphthoate octaprenyltransferase n=2 Tax=Chitinivibrio TaxID=1505231 RepID=U7D607_9BACT|nr:1,4-dihydroxy-2-naphthoate octaprenyltransferase [Chitinivibrio alkaliphilus ACht1]
MPITDEEVYFLPFLIFSMLCLHGGTNLINDYVDYSKGLDGKHHPGASAFIDRKILQKGQVRKVALFLFGIAFLCALPLFYYGGIPVVILGSIGIMGGYFYTAPPVSYKYRALGDIFVFLLMGVGPAAGVLFLFDSFQISSLFSVLPLAFYITAILHGNNIRDARHDSQYGVHTFAQFLGPVKARWVFVMEIFAAYAIVLFLYFYYGNIYIFLPYLTLPLAIRVAMTVLKSSDTDTTLMYIDKDVAKVYTLFSILYCTGILFFTGPFLQ